MKIGAYLWCLDIGNIFQNMILLTERDLFRQDDQKAIGENQPPLSASALWVILTANNGGWVFCEKVNICLG